MGLGKPKGLSLLTPDEQRAALKKSKRELGNDIHGSPDEWDYKNLSALINSYDRTYPYPHPKSIQKIREDYLVERALTTRNDFGVVSKDLEMRLCMWLPRDLQIVIERGYPSLWVNKKHLHWFLKRFPVFRASEKL